MCISHKENTQKCCVSNTNDDDRRGREDKSFILSAFYLYMYKYIYLDSRLRAIVIRTHLSK